MQCLWKLPQLVKIIQKTIVPAGSPRATLDAVDFEAVVLARTEGDKNANCHTFVQFHRFPTNLSFRLRLVSPSDKEPAGHEEIDIAGLANSLKDLIVPLNNSERSWFPLTLQNVARILSKSN
jgi:hypothetical protein